MNYQIIFPADFDEMLWQYQAKGWIAEVIFQFNNRNIAIEVFDKTRFNQDLDDEILDKNYSFFKNLLLVEHIDKQIIINAIEKLAYDI